jgi:hypothetical protein
VDFVELVVAVDAALAAKRIPHAFGGALALGFVASPRGTVDIDVNVFTPYDDLAPVDDAFRELGYEREPGEALPIAGVRFVHASEPFPIDVFPALDPRYETMKSRIVRHRFGARNNRLPFLSAEDLCIFKLFVGRPQDWVDLGAIALAMPGLDLAYIEDQLIGLRGPTMYPRVARLRGLLRDS